MKTIYQNTCGLLGFFLVFATFSSAQCNQFTVPDLGNDTILCPGETLQLDLSGLANSPTVVWEDGSQTATRTISTPGTYSVEVLYLTGNIVQNGDFEQGNTSFTTDYVVGTGGAWGQLSTPGTYAINTSPSNVHNNFSFCQDHTSGTGNMMIVNGANTPGTSVWCQTVNVTPNTDYEFSTWAANALNDPNIAQLQFTINGVQLGNPFTTQTTACTWNQFFEVWNSGTATTANICITNLNTNGGGNDFSIDDISFSPLCVFRDTIEVVYNSDPVFTLPTTYDTCVGATLTLDAENPGFDYNWSTGETTQTIQVNTSDTYSVEVSDSGYCETTQDMDVTFHQAPDAGIDDSFEFCNSDQSIDLYSLLDPGIANNGAWFDDNNQEVIGGQLDISQSANINNYDYILTSNYCPSDTATFQIDVKVFESAGDDATEKHCNDGSLNLNQLLSVNNTGSWTTLNGLSSAVFNTTNGVFTKDGLTKNVYDFQFVVDNETPCPNDTAIISIDLSELANVEFTSDLIEGCSPTTINFSDLTEVNGSKEFTWYIDGDIIGQSNTLTQTFEAVKCYDIRLEIETDNLCISSTTASNYICIHPDPIAAFDFKPNTIYSDDPTVDFINQSQLNAINQWDFHGLGQSSETNPSFTFPLAQASDYEVKLVVISDKGCIDSTFRMVKIEDQTVFYVPNAFTPDGDDNNNTFKPVMTVGVDPQNYRFEVFNRWGELLFQSNDLEVGWDGTYGHTLVQDGMYTWRIQFSELGTENVITQHGTVVLMR